MNALLEILQDYCEEVEASQITPESRFMEDLVLSSLDFFSLISEIEMEYDIHITEREIQDIVTVGDLMQIVQKKGTNYQQDTGYII